MELKQFDGQIKSELSMIEVAHAVLEQKGDVMDFTDLLSEIAGFLELSDSELENEMTQFYTDLNIDGSFISLGDNRWGLRSWYAIDSIDEELTHANDDDDERPRRRKKGKKTFGSDEIDYNSDDSEESDEYENEDFEEDEEDDKETVYGGAVEVSDHGVLVDDEDEEDLGEYKADLSALGTDDDEEDELPDGVEGDLNLIEDEEEEDTDEDY